MALRRNRQNISYGLTDALLAGAPRPIVSERAPTTADQAEIGTIWVDQPNNDSYILTSVVNNSASWINAGGGGGVFSSLTVNGPTDLNGALAVTAGNNPISLITTDNIAGSINIEGNGGAAETVVLQSKLGTTSSAVGVYALAGGITLNAPAVNGSVNIQATNTNGVVGITGGSSGIVCSTASAGGAFQLLTGTGGVFISADAAATSVEVGTGAAAKTVTIGSTTGASETTIQSGSGGLTIEANGGATPITLGSVLEFGAAGIRILTGTGAPSASVPKGSLYLRTDGSGTNDRAYIATDNAGTWTAIVTVA